MKKLRFNSTLNHKRDGYNTYEVSVEKVVTLYGKLKPYLQYRIGKMLRSGNGTKT